MRFEDDLLAPPQPTPTVATSPEDVPVALGVHSVGAELHAGLFRQPETLGWLATAGAVCSVLATGAAPTAVSLQVSAPAVDADDIGVRLLEGARACLAAMALPAARIEMRRGHDVGVSAVGVGALHGQRLDPSDLQPGDVLYTYGPCGLGNLVALSAMNSSIGSPFEDLLRPVPPVAGWQRVVAHVHGCAHTGQGLLAAWLRLMRKSGCGVSIDLGRVPFHPAVRAMAADTALPIAGFACGVTGDAGLVWAVRGDEVAAFEVAAEAAGLDAVRIGTAIDGASIVLHGEDRTWTFDEPAAQGLLDSRDAATLLSHLLL